MPTIAPPVTATNRSRPSRRRPQRSAAGSSRVLASGAEDMGASCHCRREDRGPPHAATARISVTLTPPAVWRFELEASALWRSGAAQVLLEPGVPMTDSDSPEPTVNSERLTLGIEEEFHLVDLSTRRLTPRASDVLGQLTNRPPASSRAGSATLKSSGGFAAELQQSVVETNSAVTSDLGELRGYLIELR